MLYPTSNTFQAAPEASITDHEIGGFWDGASTSQPFGVRPYDDREDEDVEDPADDFLIDELDDQFRPFFDGPLIYPPNLVFDKRRATSWTFEMSVGYRGMTFSADFGDHILDSNASFLIQAVNEDDPRRFLSIGFQFLATGEIRHGWEDEKWSPGFNMLLSGDFEGTFPDDYSSQVFTQRGFSESPSAFEVTISGESFPMFYSTFFAANEDMSGYLNLKPLTWA